MDGWINRMWSLWTLEYYSALKKEGSSEIVWVRAQSDPTLCDPVDCSPPGSSVQETLQARRVERAAISSCRSFWAGDPTRISVSLPLDSLPLACLGSPLTQATIQMNLEDILLSAMISHRKTDTMWFPFSEVARGVKFIDTEGERVGPGAGGWQSWRSMGTALPLCKTNKFWRWVGVMVV